MGREVEGRFKKKGTYVYLLPILVDVSQKPTQYCKAIILQLKINKLKKKKESTCQCRRHRFNPWSEKMPYTAEQLNPNATTTERML